MEPHWPLSSIIYQIYPRSFQDSNNDGIGDLRGIIHRLDYLSSLGVTAVWLSPIYPSPHVDMGYDITDFENIDPLFGTLQDFDELVAELHKRGIRLLMDYVPNHTSDQHPWFQQSRSSRNNPKRDWYVWADPKPDGSPPNNWISNFGGSAWEFDDTTGQYYYHAFSKAQPDLNWRNPEVGKTMLNVLRFWMERGVDGFRVDAVYALFEDELLRDEPINPTITSWAHAPYNALIHTHTFALPETLEMMKKMTDVLKEYPDKFMVTEVYAGLPELIKMYSTIDWQWYSPFNFSFLTLPWKAEAHKAFIDEYDTALGDIYIPSYVLSNHDKPRVASRIGREAARVAALLLLTLRGLPYIYYGDEIGMTNGTIPHEKVHDIYELNAPGLGLGRDPERTPMQWEGTESAGFSDHDPWLPLAKGHKEVNVEREQHDPQSFLALYKLLIKLKKHRPALREGVYTPLPSPAPEVFAFLREKDEERLLIVANFSAEKQTISLELPPVTIICNTHLTAHEGEKVELKDFTLAGNEGYIFSLQA